ncbi:hypothetical protein GF374_03435 [Candidatus Woesearchaeota archaeon]|nr:hypothetical protein [Candidatus Woesearchaeota archaeon]
MSDPETREQIIEKIKEGCALKTVLRKDKPCPHSGSSKTCADCSYDWMTIALEVIKVANFRRASYEKEMEKVKALSEKVEYIEGIVKNIFLLFGRMGEGVTAFQDLSKHAEQYFFKNEEEKTKEADNKEKDKKEKKERKNGIQAGGKSKKSKKRG